MVFEADLDRSAAYPPRPAIQDISCDTAGQVFSHAAFALEL